MTRIEMFSFLVYLLSCKHKCMLCNDNVGRISNARGKCRFSHLGRDRPVVKDSFNCETGMRGRSHVGLQ